MKRFVVSLKSGLTFATPWTVAQRAPLSIAFPRQEYWSGLPFPSPEDLPDPGIKPCIGRQILYHWATREASMKRCSTLNGIRQRQMKTMNYHYTPIRKAKPRILTTHQMLARMCGSKLSSIADGDAKWYSHFGRLLSVKVTHFLP